MNSMYCDLSGKIESSIISALSTINTPGLKTVYMSKKPDCLGTKDLTMNEPA